MRERASRTSWNEGPKDVSVMSGCTRIEPRNADHALQELQRATDAALSVPAIMSASIT
jgi:hypothetical protein